MKWVTGLKTAAQVLARLGLRGGRVHSGPLRWKLGAPLETPVAEGPRGAFADLLSPQVLEETPPDDLADFGLVVGDQVLGDAPHDLGDPILPHHVAVGHLDLAAGEADHRRSVRGSGRGG